MRKLYTHFLHGISSISFCLPCSTEPLFPLHTLTESYNTARDVLNVTRERLTQRVQRALESAAENSEGGVGEGAGGETEEGGGGRVGSSTTPEVNSALRGVSQKLLEKVTCVIPILCMYMYIHVYT